MSNTQTKSKSKAIKSVRRRKLSIQKHQVIDMTQSVNALINQDQIINLKYKFDTPDSKGNARLWGKIEESYQPFSVEKIEEKSKIVKNTMFYGDDNQWELQYRQKNIVIGDLKQKQDESVEQIKNMQGIKEPRRRLSSFKNRKAAKMSEGVENYKRDDIQEFIDSKLGKDKQEEKVEESVNEKQREKQNNSEQDISLENQQIKQFSISQLRPAQNIFEKPFILFPSNQPQPSQQPKFLPITSLPHLLSLHSFPPQFFPPQLLTLPVPKDHILQCYIKRLNRQVLMLFLDDSTFLMKSQKKSAVIGSNYYISSSKETSKSDRSYLGKLRSDIGKNSYVLYDDGWSEKEDKSQERKEGREKRMQCMNVQYQNGLFEIKQPRKFRVILPNPVIKDKNHFRQLGGHNLEYLKIIYPHQLLGLRNKKPNWNQKSNSFGLDFGKRVKVSSVKNFILETGQGETALVFGKSDADSFSLEIRYPLSAYQGFGIAISMFDVK